MEISSAAVVLPCPDLSASLEFFIDELGFVVESFWPADNPAVAELVGHGARVRLDSAAEGDAGTLILRVSESNDISAPAAAPNGTRIVIEAARPDLVLPASEQKLVISRSADGSWGVGRAGMRYRDLIPEREGGRFIASHIHIPDGGPVPDYVHHHHIRFQLIFVRSGWVRVVYEDQGDPFVMEAGDAVLQPPHIRHRVLESSDDLEVIEIGCPAEHRTAADLQMKLPTSLHRPDRDFGGQRFCRHVASSAVWERSALPGFECRNSGIDAATNGLADVRVHRAGGSEPVSDLVAHGGEFQFFFVLAGSVGLDLPDGAQQLSSGDSVTLPAEMGFRFRDPSPDLQLLDVNLPAAAQR